MSRWCSVSKEDAEMVERILSDAFATVMNGVL